MRKKKTMLCFLSAMSILVAGVAQVNAGKTNNYEFHFNIKANQGNIFSEKRERSTKDPKCAWMVDFTKSTEDAGGKACKTRFWLEKAGIFGKQVSDDHDILEGSGRKFYASTKSGTQCDVKLGAENNNYNAKTYSVTGYWDEETATILK